MSASTGKQDKHGEAVIKRVSRKHDDHGHGGAWKVAFADFCLALMCLFLVMWVLAARSQERAEEVMRSAGGKVTDDGQGYMPETVGGPRGSLISREPLPRDPEAQQPNRDSTTGLRKTRYDSPQELQALARILADMSAEAGLGANLRSVVTPYGLRVMLHDTDKEGMFQRGSAVPNERFRTLLRRMGPLFAQIDNQMLIVGHTDAVQYSGTRDTLAFSNWALSSNRAMAARSQLLGGGMPTASVLQVVGMADRSPLDAANPRAAINRRIEMLVLTTAQARNIAAMFGVPTHPVALNDDIQTMVPSPDLLRQPHPDSP
ncbi:MAG: flagellar motor protein MotB [Aquabacterium sp.]